MKDPLLKGHAKKRVSGGKHRPLSASEREIYALMMAEGVYATATLAARLQKSESWIRKCKARLRDIGLWNGKNPPGGGAPPQDSATPAPKLRLHAQKFRVSIRGPGRRYRPGLVLDVDGNNVQTFKSVVCIQSRQCFYGVDEEDALSTSMVYFERLFLRLEHDLDISVLKSRRQNVEMTYAEWASEDSELAETAYRKQQRIRIFTSDGRLRFTIDKSKGYEHEAHLPPKDGGLEDSVAGNLHIGAILDHPECPTLPELAAVVRNIAHGMDAIVQLMRPPKPPVEPLQGVPFYVG